jgi:hypothetical protein
VENMKKTKVERYPLEEIDLLDSMQSALVELLIEKGIITEEEYEKRLKVNVKLESIEYPTATFIENQTTINQPAQTRDLSEVLKEIKKKGREKVYTVGQVKAKGKKK